MGYFFHGMFSDVQHLNIVHEYSHKIRNHEQWTGPHKLYSWIAFGLPVSNPNSFRFWSHSDENSKIFGIVQHSTNLICVKRNEFLIWILYTDPACPFVFLFCSLFTVAVVVAFFFCWAPFHAQRLLASYARNNQYFVVYVITTYASGILYYLR